MLKYLFFLLPLMQAGNLLAFQGLDSLGVALAQDTQDTIYNDRGWPRKIEVDEALLVFHQPQVYSWEQFIELECWVATEIIPKKDAADTLIGAIKVKAKTETHKASRSVLIYEKEILDLQIEGKDQAFLDMALARLKSLQASPEVISLDRMLPMVDDAVFEVNTAELDSTPPKIFYSDDLNSRLVIFEGKPIWADTQVKNLSFAVNTNWPVFKYEKEETYYLLNDSTWMRAFNLWGNWFPVGVLPKEFNKLAKKEAWKDIAETISSPETQGPKVDIFASSEPAELLVLDGAPKFETIEGTNSLKAVVNTDADLIYSGEKNLYYLLLSGRWFSAPSLDGAWAFASLNLPNDFQQIPDSSAWGRLLASVPGTLQSREAVAQASIPNTAQIKSDAQPPEAIYDGEPQLEPIEGTEISYVKNSPHDIVYVDNQYYWCYQGVWFVSAYPTHGWVVCRAVPPTIYAIPPHSPMHHLSYVYAYGYSSGYVTFGYTAGYTGVYVAYGVPVYGTGYYYAPYYYYPSYYAYPVYYPYSYSYGFRATYNPYTGTYTRQAQTYGPYGGMGRAAAYNPSTGTYAWGQSAWGPQGGAGEVFAYNPRTGSQAYGNTVQGVNAGQTNLQAYNAQTNTYASTQQSYDPYGQWGESYVQRNDQWAQAKHYTDDQGTRYGFQTSGNAQGAGYTTSEGNSAGVAKNEQGDLYVGKDGDVFKKEGDNWYKHNGEEWDQVSKENLSAEQKGNVETQANQAQNNLKSNEKTSNLSQENLADRSANRAGDRNQPPPNSKNSSQAGSSIMHRSNQSPNNFYPQREYQNRQRGNNRSGAYQNYLNRGGVNRPSFSRPGGGIRRRR